MEEGGEGKDGGRKRERERGRKSEKDHHAAKGSRSREYNNLYVCICTCSDKGHSVWKSKNTKKILYNGQVFLIQNDRFPILSVYLQPLRRGHLPIILRGINVGPMVSFV